MAGVLFGGFLGAATRCFCAFCETDGLEGGVFASVPSGGVSMTMSRAYHETGFVATSALQNDTLHCKMIDRLSSVVASCSRAAYQNATPGI